MSGHGKRELALLADAIVWRDGVTADAKSEKGTPAAVAHEVPIDLIAEVANKIAGRIARGEVLVSWRETVGALCGPRQTRRVLSYLEERGHIERCVDRQLIRPVSVRASELPRV